MKFVLFHVHFGVIYRQLVNIGILTTRDVGSWWLSIPGAGIFMKNFSNGKGKMFSIFMNDVIYTLKCLSIKLLRGGGGGGEGGRIVV